MTKLTLLLIITSACSAVAEPLPPPCPDAAVPDAASIVDSCVQNEHTTFACGEEQLPYNWSAIDCTAAPKKMHPQSGTLMVRERGRDGCVEKVNLEGEHLTCCP